MSAPADTKHENLMPDAASAPAGGASGTSDASDGGAAFKAYLAKRRPLIERYLSEHRPAPEPDEPAADEMRRYAYDPFNRFTASGGKRTRPALALLGAEAVGGDPAQALSSAAAIELFQSAALIHDDIADESELRRGEPCAYLTEGTGVAINMGDLGIVRTFAGVLEDPALDDPTKLRVLGRLATMEQRTVEGQALDLGWARDGRWDVRTSDYLSMATHKTAYYSAAVPLAVGTICGGGTDAQVAALDAFGMKAGLAFQLQDDLLNIEGDAAAQGKDFRSDITEGKRTMLVTWSLEHLDEADAQELVRILSSHATDAAELDRAASLMRSAGAPDALHSYAEELVEDAKRQLEGITWADGAEAILTSMADYFVERPA